MKGVALEKGEGSGLRAMWEGEKQLPGEGSLWEKQKADLK